MSIINRIQIRTCVVVISPLYNIYISILSVHDVCAYVYLNYKILS